MPHLIIKSPLHLRLTSAVDTALNFISVLLLGGFHPRVMMRRVLHIADRTLDFGTHRGLRYSHCVRDERSFDVVLGLLQ
jgi:replication-associated recombination protein RarA